MFSINLSMRCHSSELWYDLWFMIMAWEIYGIIFKDFQTRGRLHKGSRSLFGHHCQTPDLGQGLEFDFTFANNNKNKNKNNNDPHLNFPGWWTWAQKVQTTLAWHLTSFDPPPWIYVEYRKRQKFEFSCCRLSLCHSWQCFRQPDSSPLL